MFQFLRINKLNVSISKNFKVRLFIGVLLLIFFILTKPRNLFDTPYSTILTDKESVLLGAQIADDGQWRFPPGDSIPFKFKKSLLLFEDEYFYWHPGINPVSIGRAIVQNIKEKKQVSGGSTITMQVIRLSKPAKRNVFNKIKEIYLAVRLEFFIDKDSILSLYVAEAPFGGNIVGLEAAAWRYFNRPSFELTWAEAALLSVLPNAPAMVHPGKNRQQLLEKRNRLLQKLYQKQVIDLITYQLSLAEPLPEKPFPIPQKATHLLNTMLKEHRGKRIETTIDHRLQQLADNVINRHADRLKQNQIHNAAAIIVSVETGHVLAYIGNSRGEDITKGHQVDIIRASRSSGSVLKPILYAKSLQEGIILPKTLLPDVPTYYRNFTPQNYQRRFDGAVFADEALSRSLNVPFVRLLNEYGGDIFLNDLQKMGFTTVNKPYSHYGLSLILGGSEVTLWDLAGCYASLARILNNFVEKGSVYFDNDFKKLTFFPQKYDKKIKQQFNPFILSASAIYFTLKALTNVQRPPEELGWENFSSSRQIAWKTGTSYGFRDAWSIGITPEYVVAVWVGNATGEGHPAIIGGTTAAPIMFELFNLLPPTSKFLVPYDDFLEITVCKKSGFRNSEYCEDVDTVYIPVTVKQTGACPYHYLIHLTKDGLHQTRIDCEPSGELNSEKRFVLPPVIEWYYKQLHPEYKSLPPFKQGCQSSELFAPMDFIYPPPGTTVYVPIGLDGNLSRIVLKAVHRNLQATLHWHFNNEYFGDTNSLHQIEVLPVTGINYITIVDDLGNRLTKSFMCVGE
ncbi:MAG: penicillin-binding protein 1C [Marinilabiliaceae bacterium]|nr:penicillin-binding protein 1C [Marinilabiliaceae bacterium]